MALVRAVIAFSLEEDGTWAPLRIPVPVLSVKAAPTNPLPFDVGSIICDGRKGLKLFVATTEDRSRVYVAGFQGDSRAFGILTDAACPLALLRCVRWLLLAPSFAHFQQRAAVLVLDVPAPPPGHGILLREVLGGGKDAHQRPVFSLRLPPLNDMPNSHMEADEIIYMLFRLFPSSAILAVHRCMLLERRVLLLIDENHEFLLPVIADAFLSLLQPIKWQSTYIPCLPLAVDVETILEAPFPFIIGCSSQRAAALPRGSMDEVVAVDCNDGSVRVPAPLATKASLFSLASPFKPAAVPQRESIEATPELPARLASSLQGSLFLHAKHVHPPGSTASGSTPSTMGGGSGRPELALPPYLSRPPPWMTLAGGSTGMHACVSDTPQASTNSSRSRDGAGDNCQVAQDAVTYSAGRFEALPELSACAEMHCVHLWDTVMVPQSAQRAVAGIRKSFLEMMAMLLGDFDEFFVEVENGANVADSGVKEAEGGTRQAQVCAAAAFLGLTFDFKRATSAKSGMQPFIGKFFETQGFSEFLSQRLRVESISDAECLFFDAFVDNYTGVHRSSFLTDPAFMPPAATDTLLITVASCPLNASDVRYVAPTRAATGYQQAMESLAVHADSTRGAAMSDDDTPGDAWARLDALDAGFRTLRNTRLSMLPLTVSLGVAQGPSHTRRATISRQGAATRVLRVQHASQRLSLSPLAQHAGIKRTRSQVQAGISSSSSNGDTAQQTHQVLPHTPGAATTVTARQAAAALGLPTARKRRRLLMEMLEPQTEGAVQAEAEQAMSPASICFTTVSFNEFTQHAGAPTENGMEEKSSEWVESEIEAAGSAATQPVSSQVASRLSTGAGGNVGAPRRNSSRGRSTLVGDGACDDVDCSGCGVLPRGVAVEACDLPLVDVHARGDHQVDKLADRAAIQHSDINVIDDCHSSNVRLSDAGISSTGTHFLSDCVALASSAVPDSGTVYQRALTIALAENALLRVELQQAQRDRVVWASQLARSSRHMRVCVRVKPMSAHACDAPVVLAHGSTVLCPAAAGGGFVSSEFDGVFGPDSTQSDVFREIEPAVLRVVHDGENASVLAYGQTGSGKTFTMDSGVLDSPLAALIADGSNRTAATAAPQAVSTPSSTPPIALSPSCGLYARSVVSIFRSLEELGAVIDVAPDATATVAPSKHAIVRLSVLEIYNEIANDLLSPCLSHSLSCDCRGCERGHPLTTGVHVRLPTATTGNKVLFQALAAPRVASPLQALELLTAALAARAQAPTAFNERSSRSHAIVILDVTVNTHSLVGSSVVHASQTGRLILGDLAGSEKLSGAAWSAASGTSGVGGGCSSHHATSSAADTVANTTTASTGSKAGSKPMSWSASKVFSNLFASAPAATKGNSQAASADSTAAMATRLKESTAINLSLTCLGRVLTVLAEAEGGKKPAHLPLRDSLLTMCLADCLGGNSHAIMLCMVTPHATCAAETISTLQFAARARLARTTPVSSVGLGVGPSITPSIATAAEGTSKTASLRTEVAALRAQVAERERVIARLQDDVTHLRSRVGTSAPSGTHEDEAEDEGMIPAVGTSRYKPGRGVAAAGIRAIAPGSSSKVAALATPALPVGGTGRVGVELSGSCGSDGVPAEVSPGPHTNRDENVTGRSRHATGTGDWSRKTRQATTASRLAAPRGAPLLVPAVQTTGFIPFAASSGSVSGGIPKPPADGAISRPSTGSRGSEAGASTPRTATTTRPPTGRRRIRASVAAAIQSQAEHGGCEERVSS